MSARGIYNRLLELRESKDLVKIHWAGMHECIGFVNLLSVDTVTLRHIDSMGEEDGNLTVPTAQITHIEEETKEITQIKQYLLQKR